ncbi:hypothetical protein KCP71_22495 [Salmonella enterica subsp. enterica]|nr:hypothetical protein KCP71_22495 [Salmonella enterica subsp. enterica]
MLSPSPLLDDGSVKRIAQCCCGMPPVVGLMILRGITKYLQLLYFMGVRQGGTTMRRRLFGFMM